jgi:hypothetical protein
MSIDYSALLYDPVYAELGVDAIFTAAGTAGVAAITVIDGTAPNTNPFRGAGEMAVGAAPTVRSVDPVADVRIPELAANGIARADYRGSILEFNGRTWVVRSYELRGSPNGEDAGEVRLFLKAVEST